MNDLKPNEQLLNESTKVAQEAAKAIGGTFTQGNYDSTGKLTGGFAPNIPSSITSSSLASASPINLPTPEQPSTTSSAITAGVESKLTQAKTEADKLQQDYYNRAKDEASASKSKAEEYLGLGTKTLEERVNAMQAPDFLEKKKASDEAYKALQTSRASQMAEIKALESSGVVGTAASNAVNAITQRYAYTNAQLSLSYDIAGKDYESAKQSINDLYQLKMEAYQPYINYYTQLAANNKNIFNQADLKIIENKRDEYKTLQTQEAEFVKTKGTAQIAAKEAGAPDSVIQAMGRATNATELATAAGQYAGGLDAQLKRAQIYKAQTEARQALTTLPAATQTRVQTIAGQFDNEQAVKNFQTIAETVDAVKNAGTTPTDDIQRVYAVAKVFDPNSAVREGEYKTIQDYATTLLQKAGLKANRVFNNDGFLTDEARKFINTSLDNRLSSSKKAYDNIYQSYGSRIDKVTGKTDGKDYITDYSAAFKTGSQDQYTPYRNQLKTGEILIERNGQVGAIPEGEFNAKTDKKI